MWRKRRIIFVGFSLLLLTSIVVCALTVQKVYSFRKHPRRHVALELFEGDLPHNILARMLVFKRGTYDYTNYVMKWAHESKKISDTPWNRWILEGSLARLPDDERTELLPYYPLTPTSRSMPFIRESLDQNRHQVLPLLGRSNTEEDRAIAREWIQERILTPRNSKLFISSAGSLVQSDGYPFGDILGTFWPQLSVSQRDWVLAKVAVHLPEDPQRANGMFGWMKSSLAADSAKMSCGMVAVLGHFLSIRDFRDQTLDLIAQEGNDLEASHVPLLLHFADTEEAPQFAKMIADRIKDTNPYALLELFHDVAHLDITMAEELAAPFLQGGDSEVRKGIIVLLVRHGSLKGRARIDEAFKGEAARKILFQSAAEYSTGSVAADLYRRLSTHDYRQTGKTWPPSYFGSGPSPEELSEWKGFIGSYPWFPGTDDAYYRLAFSQYAQKNYQGCLSTIKDYVSRGYWPDNDAKPYLMHLLRILALASNVSDSEMPYVPHIRNIAAHPLAGMITGSSEHIESVIRSINWFLSNLGYIQFLDTDERTLKIMRDVAETIRNSPPDSVCRLVAAKLMDNESYQSPSVDEPEDHTSAMIEDEDDDDEARDIMEACSGEAYSSPDDGDGPAGTTLSVLYGVFRNFKSPEHPALSIDIPRDSAEDAIRSTARFLNSQFSSMSIESIRDGQHDEIIVLALLHSGDHAFDKWHDDLKPTMDFISAVDHEYIPAIVSEKHLGLLKRK